MVTSDRGTAHGSVHFQWAACARLFTLSRLTARFTLAAACFAPYVARDRAQAVVVAPLAQLVLQLRTLHLVTRPRAEQRAHLLQAGAPGRLHACILSRLRRRGARSTHAPALRDAVGRCMCMGKQQARVSNPNRHTHFRSLLRHAYGSGGGWVSLPFLPILFPRGLALSRARVPWRAPAA